MKVRRKKEINPFDPSDIETIMKIVTNPNVISRSMPSKTIARWRSYIPEDRFKVFFFDELCRDPDALRGDILTFL